MTSMTTRKVKSLAKELLPPIVLRLIRTLRPAYTKVNDKVKGREQPPEFYDQMFLTKEEWRKHYTESKYYPLWTVVTDRMMRAKVNSVLDIGCGSGQMALLLRNKGLPRYLGFDFSLERINYAKEVCPKFDFVVADAFKTDLFSIHDYDAVLCTEFLEHVERDLEVIEKIHTGRRFYGTVPNFPHEAHVRHFLSTQEVYNRYAQYFHSFSVDAHLSNTRGTTFYILEGIKC